MKSYERIGFLIGCILTALFTILSASYFNSLKYGSNSTSFMSGIMNFVETMESRYHDVKFKIKPIEKSNAPVALVAIDNDSLREIGRWPWNRSLVADMVDRLFQDGAKHIAFDVIFSEQDKGDNSGDRKLAAVVEKYGKNLTLGVFSESENVFEPYQDYCVNEAFLQNSGAELTPLNAQFIVEDLAADDYDSLNWSEYFKPIFDQVKISKSQSIISDLESSESLLTNFQKNYLESEKTKSIFNYCHRWLTDRDPFLKHEFEKFNQGNYLANLAKDKSENYNQFFERFKRNAKFHLVPQYAMWTGNIAEIQRKSQSTASFVVQLDPDGMVRRYTLFNRVGNKLGSSFIPSLALQTYLSATGYRADVQIGSKQDPLFRAVDQFQIINSQVEPEQKVMQLPVDYQGRLQILYSGPSKTLPHVSSREIFSNKKKIKIRELEFNDKTQKYDEAEKLVDRKEFFKDRSLIVGATAIAVYDLRNTPIEANYPGPEIHLNVLANLFDKSFIYKWPQQPWQLYVLLVLSGLLFSWFFSHAISRNALLVYLVFLFGFAWFDYYIFAYHHILLSSFYIILNTTFCYLLITMWRLFTEERRKAELKATFARYVSPAIVDEILKHPENVKLGGRRQRMTVLFSDIRDFTSISEKLDPVVLSQLLNRYLSPMTDLIFQNEGTLDKYIGDAIMAFFGAPLYDEKHSEKACRCALEFKEGLRHLQIEFEKDGLPRIEIGVGINTGEMSVGNMGSNRLQNYTVLGDAVNTASRLEGLNKEYGTQIIISQFTQLEIGEKFKVREIDLVRVKGKKEPVKIFELVCEGNPSEEVKVLLEDFSKAYRKYRELKFNEAEREFLILADKLQDSVSRIYVKRCREFIENPPPMDWDGVFIMKEK